VVRDQIRDKLPYSFDDLGEQAVKNIARPVRVYEMRPEAIVKLPASGVSPPSLMSRPTRAPRLPIGAALRQSQRRPGAGIFR
jgi:hypothetical protein